jgi:Transglutaminase-like superfamily
MAAATAHTFVMKARRELERPADLFLLARMVGWACALRLLKHSVSLPRLVRLTRWAGPAEPRSRGRGERVVTLARWACRASRWSSRGNCLERGLVTYRYLAAAGAPPTLVIGVAAPSSPADVMRGHAWVTVGNSLVGETAASIAEFHPVLAFVADGHCVPVSK